MKNLRYWIVDLLFFEATWRSPDWRRYVHELVGLFLCLCYFVLSCTAAAVAGLFYASVYPPETSVVLSFLTGILIGMVSFARVICILEENL